MLRLFQWLASAFCGLLVLPFLLLFLGWLLRPAFDHPFIWGGLFLGSWAVMCIIGWWVNRDYLRWVRRQRSGR